MKRILTSTIAIAAAVALTSCEGGPNAQTGTLIGAGTGALAGGIIGHNTGRGNTAQGAIIGGVVGAAAGNAIGGSQDRRNQSYGQPQPLYYDSYGRPVYRRY